MFGNDLAVVPILVSGGAAILPAIAAGLATFFTLLFKPKALLAACRRKPKMAFSVLAGITGVVLLVVMWPAPAVSGGRGQDRRAGVVGGAAGASVYVDWTEVALARIEAKARGVVQDPAPAPSFSPEARETPLIFRGNALRLGAEGSAPVGDLQLVWDYYPSWVDFDGTVETVESAMMLSSPLVFGDRVYSASCELDPPDSYGIVFCVDARTGETIWSVDQVGGEELMGFFSSPALTADGKYLLIGQGLHPDTNCRLLCLDAETGEVKWTVTTELHIESSPAIEEGIVYVGAGAIEDPVTRQPKSHPGYVFAVRIADGKELWRHQVNDPESSPVVQDGVVYIGSGFNGQAVVALRAEATLPDGVEREIWRTETPYPITGAVTLKDGTLYVGGGNGDFVFRDPNPAGVIVALEAKTGALKWQAKMPDAVLGAVAAAESLVAPVASGQVVALDPENGEILWETILSGRAPVLAGAAVVQDWVYAVSHDGYLAKLSLSDGSIVERVYLNDRARPGEQGLSISSPFLSGGRLFVGSETGGLRCYEGRK